MADAKEKDGMDFECCPEEFEKDVWINETFLKKVIFASVHDDMTVGKVRDLLLVGHQIERPLDHITMAIRKRNSSGLIELTPLDATSLFGSHLASIKKSDGFQLVVPVPST